MSEANEEKMKEQINELFLQLKDLEKQGEWQEIVDLVNANIKKYANSREENGTKIYQFPSWTDLSYYVTCYLEDKDYIWDFEGIEFRLLYKKLDALIQLKEYYSAKFLIYYLLKLSPNYAPLMFKELLIAKIEFNLDKCEKILNEIHKSAWNHIDFARMLHGCAWVSIEKGDFTSAINYLELSLYYDNSELANEYVNKEFDYMKDTFNLENIDRPELNQIIEFFKGNEVFSPTTENMRFCEYFYSKCLMRKNEIEPQILEEAKHNLIMMNLNYPPIADMIEIETLTPNRLFRNSEYGFKFQISKECNLLEPTKEKIRLFRFALDKRSLCIDFYCKCDYENFDKCINQIKQSLMKKGHETINEKLFYTENNMKVYETVTSKGGKLTLSYYFNINTKNVGRISIIVKEDYSVEENIIKTILNTWSLINEE